jgi:hypothetical protein
MKKQGKDFWVPIIVVIFMVAIFVGFGSSVGWCAEYYPIKGFQPLPCDSIRYIESDFAGNQTTGLVTLVDSFSTSCMNDSISIDETEYHSVELIVWFTGYTSPVSETRQYLPSASVTGTVDANIVSADNNALSSDAFSDNLDVNIVEVSGNSTAADNFEEMVDGDATGAPMNLTKLHIRAGTNDTAFLAVGNGYGGGMYVEGGDSVAGAKFVGGSTARHGFECWGVAPSASGLYAHGSESGSGSGAFFKGGESGNGSGLQVQGYGSGNGMMATAGPTGAGILAYGGSTTGHGFYGVAQNGDGQGMRLQGIGSGPGFTIVGGATGYGMSINGGSTSGDAVKFLATSGSGMSFAVSGTDINGTIDSVDNAPETSVDYDSVQYYVAKVATDSSTLYQGEAAGLDSTAVAGAVYEQMGTWHTDSTIIVIVDSVTNSAIRPASFSSAPSVNVSQISGDAGAADNMEYFFDGTGVANDVDLSARSLELNNDAGMGLAVGGLYGIVVQSTSAYDIYLAGDGRIVGTIDSVDAAPEVAVSFSAEDIEAIAGVVKDTATANPGLFYGPTASGTGNDTITFWVIDTASGSVTGDDGLQSAKITVYNSAGEMVAGPINTNSAGYATVTLDEDPINRYAVSVFRIGYHFPTYGYLVTGNSDSVAVKGYNTQSPNKASLWGYLIDASDEPISGARVYARPSGDCVGATVDSATATTTKGMANFAIYDVTDSLGFFNIPVIKSTEVDKDKCGFYEVAAKYGNEYVFQLPKVWVTDDFNVLDSVARR